MCGNDCFEIGPPPPDTILSLPPPPLPAFLLPRSGKFQNKTKIKTSAVRAEYHVLNGTCTNPSEKNTN